MSSNQRESIMSSMPRLRAGLLALVLAAAAGASAAEGQTAPVITITEVVPTTNCQIASCFALEVKWSVQVAPQIVIQSQQLLAEVGLSNGATQNTTPLTVDGSKREARLLLAEPPKDTVKTFRLKIFTTFAQPTVTSVEKEGTLPPVLVPVDRDLGVVGGLGKTSSAPRRLPSPTAAPGPTQEGQSSPARPQPLPPKRPPRR